MARPSLKYSLQLDREEFDMAERLVKAVLLTGKKNPRPFSTLVQVTDNYDRLSDNDRKFIQEWPSEEKGILEGLCCWDPKDAHKFSIWLSPQMNPMSDLYRLSLLHELVHGYMNYSAHDAKFRRVLGRVMYHYCDIVCPLDDPGFQVLALNYRYTRQRRGEYDSDYLQRLVTAKDEIQTIAETEYSQVLEMYERIA